MVAFNVASLPNKIPGAYQVAILTDFIDIANITAGDWDDHANMALALCVQDKFQIRHINTEMTFTGNSRAAYNALYDAYQADLVTGTFPASSLTRRQLEQISQIGPPGNPPGTGYRPPNVLQYGRTQNAALKLIKAARDWGDPSGTFLTNPYGKLHVAILGGFEVFAQALRAAIVDGVQPDFLDRCVFYCCPFHNGFLTESAWAYWCNNHYFVDANTPGLFGATKMLTLYPIMSAIGEHVDAAQLALYDQLKVMGTMGPQLDAVRDAGNFPNEVYRASELGMMYYRLLEAERIGSWDPTNAANGAGGALQTYPTGNWPYHVGGTGIWAHSSWPTARTMFSPSHWATSPTNDTIVDCVAAWDMTGWRAWLLENFSRYAASIGTFALAAASDTGTSSTDNLTNDSTPTFEIAGPISDTDFIQIEQLFGTYAVIATHTVNGAEETAGLASVTPSNPIAEGVQDFRVRITHNSVPGSYVPLTVTFDFTPPSLTDAEGVVTGVDTANVGVDSDTIGGTSWFVVTDSATAPTIAQVKLGQNHLGAAGFDSATGSVLTTPIFAGASNLGSGLRWVHWVQRDPAGNDSVVVTSPSWTQGAVDTPDPLTATWVSSGTAPNPTFGIVPTGPDVLTVNDVVTGEVYTDVGLTALLVTFQNTLDSAEVAAQQIVQTLNLVNGQYWVRLRWKHQNGLDSGWSNTITQTIAVAMPPVLTNPTATPASSQVNTDTSTGVLFLVISTSSTPPNVTRMAAGQDHTGAPAFHANNQNISTIGLKTFNTAAVVFDPGTPYFAHLAHRNASLVWSGVVTSDGFSVGASDVLTVVWATGPTQPDPQWDMEPPAGDAFAVGDTINGEIYNDPSLTTLVESFETVLVATNFGVGFFNEPMTLPNATYYARFRWKHASASYSGWSATLVQVISV